MPRRADTHPPTHIEKAVRDAVFGPSPSYGVRPSDEGVKEFKAIYERLHGEPISDDDAREMARRVLTLYELLARPTLEEAEELRRIGQDRTSPLQ